MCFINKSDFPWVYHTGRSVIDFYQTDAQRGTKAAKDLLFSTHKKRCKKCFSLLCSLILCFALRFRFISRRFNTAKEGYFAGTGRPRVPRSHSVFMAVNIASSSFDLERCILITRRGQNFTTGWINKPPQVCFCGGSPLLS